GLLPGGARLDTAARPGARTFLSAAVSEWNVAPETTTIVERSELAADRNVRAPGFTLVEMLVVVAVIAILAALLLPALARSRASAQRIKCVSNLHQLGLAARMYWDDSGGSCFLYGGWSTNGGQLYWFGWMESTAVAEGQRQFDATQGALYPYLQGRG